MTRSGGSIPVNKPSDPFCVKTTPSGHQPPRAASVRPMVLFFLFSRDPLTLGSRLIWVWIWSSVLRQKRESPNRALSFLVPRLRRGSIRFAQLSREGHTLPSRALPMPAFPPLRVPVFVLHQKRRDDPLQSERTFDSLGDFGV